MIVPTLAVGHKPQVQWTMPSTQKQTQSKSFRLSTTHKASAIINGTKKMERPVSTSLPDLPLGQL